MSGTDTGDAGAGVPGDTGLADTGLTDTGAASGSQDSSDCATYAGSGCLFPIPTCGDGESSSTGGLSGGTLAGDGGGPDCATAPPSTLLAIVLVYVVRRFLPIVLATLSLPAFAFDVQGLHARDGGTFVTIEEPRTDGAPRAALTQTLALRPLVYRLEDATLPVVDSVATTTLSGSFALGKRLRVGVSLPAHLDVNYAPLAGGGVARDIGDLGFWATYAVLGSSVSLIGGAELPTGNAERLLSTGGAARIGGTVQTDAGPGSAALNMVLRLQKREQLPGVTWGSRVELAGGYDVPLLDGALHTTAEVFATTPLLEGSGPAYYPMEALLTARIRLPWGLWLRAGGGSGLTHGLSSPRGRFVAAIEHQVSDDGDLDGDGLADARDACPRRPEDYDNYKDGDGCPELDNDKDTIVDTQDLCPNVPEVFNAWRDEDGCPDHITDVRIIVMSDADAIESVALTAGDQPRAHLLGGEVWTGRLPAGRVPLTVSSGAHHPFDSDIQVREVAHQEFVVTLASIKWGALLVRLVGPEGEPLTGEVEILGNTAPIGVEGLRRPTMAGNTEITARARGYLPRTVEVQVSPSEELSAVISLSPTAVTLFDDEIRVGKELRFELDSHQIASAGEPVIDDLAALLDSHPEIQLVRVEGHSDGTGSSRYNYELSIRRAEAVRTALMNHGIAPERLISAGNGEAEVRNATDASRRVGFLVLIWNDQEN